MQENPNPYSAPEPDRKTLLQIRLRRRKLKNLALSIGLFFVLFPVYLVLQYGIGIFHALNDWLLGRP
jgi:hypothetical protein